LSRPSGRFFPISPQATSEPRTSARSIAGHIKRRPEIKSTVAGQKDENIARDRAEYRNSPCVVPVVLDDHSLYDPISVSFAG